MKRFLIVLVVMSLFTGGAVAVSSPSMEKTVPNVDFLRKVNADLIELINLRDDEDFLKKVNDNLKGLIQGEDMIAFYPLNKDYEGRDLLNPDKSIELVNVAFNFPFDDQWISTPAYFEGMENSYGTVKDNPDLSTSGSFSYIASVFPERNNQGPLMEIDYGNKFNHNGPLLWFVNPNRFYGGVEFPTCRRQDLFTASVYDEGTAPNKWFDVAMVYSHETKTISIWVDGKKKESKVACTEEPNHEGVSPLRLTIGKRSYLPDNRYFKGRVTCMRLYNKAMTYEEMEASTRFCRNNEE